MSKSKCFKAYDVRGRIPDELDEALARDIGKAFTTRFPARNVVVGYDIRLTSPAFAEAVSEGLNQGGADVTNIGQCGTEEIYFATAKGGFDGGIMVTASHNPADYNGMKFVREEARPISADSGLFDIRDIALSGEFATSDRVGSVKEGDFRPEYIEHLLSYVNLSELKPLKIVANPGNGCAGPVMDELEKHLPFELIKIQYEPDGTFPNGIPNPLLPENRDATAKAVREYGADLGLAWDGDFDRCFLFDEDGGFIEGYYIVGLLAEAMLKLHPGAAIIHDPRLTWNTLEIVEQMGGRAVQCKSGHAFIKEKMREEDAVYGGEMSAHHYFRDFSYADSGMITWLLVAGLMSATGKKLSELVGERMAKFPCSGEINSRLEDAAAAIKAVEEKYVPGAKIVERVDGLSVEFDEWRFNLRSSNTEPVLRLNVESRGNVPLMQEKTEELLSVIRSF